MNINHLFVWGGTVLHTCKGVDGWWIMAFLRMVQVRSSLFHGHYSSFWWFICHGVAAWKDCYGPDLATLPKYEKDCPWHYSSVYLKILVTIDIFPPLSRGEANCNPSLVF